MLDFFFFLLLPAYSPRATVRAQKSQDSLQSVLTYLLFEAGSLVHSCAHQDEPAGLPGSPVCLSPQRRHTGMTKASYHIRLCVGSGDLHPGPCCLYSKRLFHQAFPSLGLWGELVSVPPASEPAPGWGSGWAVCGRSEKAGPASFPGLPGLYVRLPRAWLLLVSGCLVVVRANFQFAFSDLPASFNEPHQAS